MNREARTQIAQETLQILNSGSYIRSAGTHVDISRDLQSSVRTTRVIRPDQWPQIIAGAREKSPDGVGRIEVTGETTLAALHRVLVAEEYLNVAALNSASAKNAGGGFLGGSQAQEESLARSSGLYATLEPQSAYYQANRKCGSLMYTDHAILSGCVPVFRDDDGTLLEQAYPVTFITMPAVNAGAMNASSAEVAAVMEHRMNCIFALAASTGSRHLVLGAWGCGVFRNDPDQIAQLFARCLSGPASWRSHFDRIVFAVFDPTPDARNREPFERWLAKLDG